ncbi:MAG: HNH endonuclease, partial [Longimicrobiales bacterium]|nr:HNH endonuclease [Longimicrobiales bacterium]
MVRFAPRMAHLFLVREHAVPEYGDRAVEATPAPTLDPFDDADSLEELEEEIATLAAHIHAATHRLLTLIAEFDRRRGWELGGHRSCAYWLSARTGIDLGAAREKVRTARALESLPETGASMARGELSFSKVRALSRVATAANEGDLLEFARGCTTAQLERMVRGFRRGSREDEAAWERRLHESRTLSVFPDEDGMVVVRGRLPAEVGALLMRAVEAASDALFREQRVPGLEAVADRDTQREAAQRRADALGLLAERALEAGFGGRGGGGGDGEDGADSESGAGQKIPISGTRAQRYQVVLHVEAATLGAEGEPGRSELEDGTNLSAATSRRLSCDCGLVRISHAPDGSILDVGRRTRTISPALRRALEARDQGCRFPGCGLRFTEGHHVTHWADGGETSLGNTLLTCRFHHRLLHEGGWKVDWWGPGRPVFFDARGGTHFDGRWTPPDVGKRPVAALIEQNHLRGARPDGWTAGARWKREADIPES